MVLVSLVSNMLLTHDAFYLKIGPATVPGSIATIP